MFVRCKSCEKIYICSMADILEEGWGIITGTAKEGYETVYLCPECKEAYDSISESPGKGIEEMEIAKRTLNAFYGNKNIFASQCFNSACLEKSSKTQTWKEFCEEENKRRIKDLEKESKRLKEENCITNDIYTAKEAVKIMRNSIKKIIFNDPATIIIWGNGDKTIVKCGEGETYDPEKGMAMAIAKHFLGDKGNYYETFKKWLPKENETVKESKSNTERFISIRDFCNRCNITKNKAYRMIKAGDIYAIKNERGHWMIDTTAGVIKYM